MRIVTTIKRRDYRHEIRQQTKALLRAARAAYTDPDNPEYQRQTEQAQTQLRKLGRVQK